MYHGVPRQGRLQPLDCASFERQIVFLKRNCTFIHAEQYALTRSSLRQPAVLLTFDDGFRNNAEVAAPILRRHNVPAVFFVASRHCTPGRYLWFTYLRMLKAFFPGSVVRLNGKSISLKGADRERGIQEVTRQLLKLNPHPRATYDAIESQLPALESFVRAEILADEGQGMQPDQIGHLAQDPLFTVGAHTVDHPQLTRCESTEVAHQLAHNKAWLENVTGKVCDQFAYPEADFDRSVLEQCRRLGFQQAFGTERISTVDDQFAIRRIGVYSRSLAPLGVKLWCGHWLPVTTINKLLGFVRNPVAAIESGNVSSA
jgi:peptidoglycan/xylan/chitin deacetylase (PgdA/CDA1 family)